MRGRVSILVLCALAVVGAAAQQPAETSRPSFSEWLAGVKTDALARGIREDVVDKALATVDEPVPVVIERDRRQAEAVFSLEKYIARSLTLKVRTAAREKYQEHHDLLEEIGSRYGVSPRILIGIWGIESNFGRFTGARPTIPALATLAWDPRRAAFFRGELLDALEILNRGDIDLEHLRGSWAGAMGQVQFMPSSYLQWAEDFDGDGRRDIWSTPADVFASIANYLKGHGWTADQPWGREVKITADVRRRIVREIDRRDGPCLATREMTVPLAIAKWNELGVRGTSGKRVPGSDLPASLVSGTTRHFLVYGNYDALLAYNCAHSYALTVGLLADSLIRSAEP
ncbi:MAG TPA: lytic murein transglycosylase [Vicinamibacterales bacterium]|nr:lytic murein transglycosylase [Vicinamibacterales bacterium]